MTSEIKDYETPRGSLIRYSGTVGQESSPMYIFEFNGSLKKETEGDKYVHVYFKLEQQIVSTIDGSTYQVSLTYTQGT